MHWKHCSDLGTEATLSRFLSVLPLAPPSNHHIKRIFFTLDLGTVDIKFKSTYTFLRKDNKLTSDPDNNNKRTETVLKS